MTNAISSFRLLFRRLTPVLGLLLLTLLFVGGAHQHSDGARHTCAVCAIGQATAVAADIAAPTGSPASPPQAVPARTGHTPRPIRIETAPSRAPPLA